MEDEIFSTPNQIDSVTYRIDIPKPIPMWEPSPPSPVKDAKPRTSMKGSTMFWLALGISLYIWISIIVINSDDFKVMWGCNSTNLFETSFGIFIMLVLWHVCSVVIMIALVYHIIIYSQSHIIKLKKWIIKQFTKFNNFLDNILR